MRKGAFAKYGMKSSPLLKSVNLSNIPQQRSGELQVKNYSGIIKYQLVKRRARIYTKLHKLVLQIDL